MGLKTIQRFGQISSEESLKDVKKALNVGKYEAPDMVVHKSNKFTATASGHVTDISTMLEEYYQYPPPCNGYDGVVMLFLDRTSNVKVTVDYCGTRDGEAYSQTANWATGQMHGMWMLSWNLYAENYENNCKVKFTTSSNRTMHYQFIILFRHNDQFLQ